MKAIIDEGVPRRLAHALRNHGFPISSFPQAWKGLRNGELLARLEKEGFTCLLTCDKSMRFQQNIQQMSISIVVLPAQHFDDLAPILADIVATLKVAAPGKVSQVGPSK